jgi:hypothetical protein
VQLRHVDDEFEHPCFQACTQNAQYRIHTHTHKHTHTRTQTVIPHVVQLRRGTSPLPSLPPSLPLKLECEQP